MKKFCFILFFIFFANDLLARDAVHVDQVKPVNPVNNIIQNTHELTLKDKTYVNYYQIFKHKLINELITEPYFEL